MNPPTATEPKRGLKLDRVVLLGRTLEEYVQYFGLDLEEWRGKRILDVASGVSSFTPEARALGLDVTAVDPIYTQTPADLASRCAEDLELVCRGIVGTNTYKWDFYKNAEKLQSFRERAYRTFLADFALHPGYYWPGGLPNLPFAHREFDLTLVSYFLFVYEQQLSYEFHRDALLELLRVTREEIRIYPTITFDGHPSAYLDRLKIDPAFQRCRFEIVPTTFEFLVGSNNYLRITT